MCGIIGWIMSGKSSVPNKVLAEGVEELLLLSETRGKEASGICCVDQDKVQIYKDCVRAKKLVLTKEFDTILENMPHTAGRMIMGHARMVTNGDRNNIQNNQPVVRNDLVCIHNGIIVNDLELWEKNPDLVRNAEVDTEVFLALMEKYRYQDDLLGALEKCLMDLKGSLSIALIDRTSDHVLLYTNTGSLYAMRSKSKKMIMFASEKYILEQTVKKQRLEHSFSTQSIKKISPRKGLLINIADCSVKAFELNGENEKITKGEHERKIEEHYAKAKTQRVHKPMTNYYGKAEQVESLLQVDLSKIRKLRRCTRCLLPETFPGISFDKDGVCSVCKEYKKKELKGEEALRKVLEKNKTAGNAYDCIVPLSGGRDSCYMIHYMVKEMGAKVVAYTYDWGMVTDLARRNIQRMCSELGVEHILVSADIGKKRKNVQLNVKAWLKHPQLATVPLFMAGDKQFFYYAQLLKRQMHIDNIIFGMNSLEETQFKVRFASNRKTGDNGIYYDLPAKGKIDLMMAYGKEFTRNPAYLNRSLLDSFSGYLSYYVLPKDYVHLFDYIPWDQTTVENVIINEYGWEKAKGTDETWRIGDGTAPFYNYIYYKLAGFTEFDTFKSNQIREGMIDRETALATLETSNRISVQDFIWYCEAIEIDPVETLKIINAQKPLYG